MRHAQLTVFPRLTRPASGRRCPVSRRSRVVLPAPLAPDHADPLAGREPPRHVVEQGDVAPARVVDPDVLDVDDVLAQAHRGELLQGDGVAGRRLVGDELGGGVDAELRLGRARRGAPAQPGELLAGQVAPTLLGDLGDALPLDPGQDPRRVAALVGVDDGVVDLPRLRAHRVEEPPVVGDDHERPAPGRPAGAQVRGQPRHAVDVEVVGGLVQQEDVGVVDQHRGQRHPAQLTAGQLVGAGVHAAHARGVGPAEQAADHVAHPRVARPRVRLGGPLPQHDLGHGGAARPVALVEHRDPHPAADGDPAGVHVARAGQHPQQGGLAVPVAPDHADHVAVVDPEGHLVQQDAVRQGDVDAGDVDEVGHG